MRMQEMNTILPIQIFFNKKDIKTNSKLFHETKLKAYTKFKYSMN